jgi:hypothetical protein
MIKTLFILSLFFLQGCLIFHKVSYQIKLDGTTNGTADITIHDIRSDARSELIFEEDKHNLFEFALKSTDFTKQMELEGKELLKRELFNQNDTLKGRIIYSFKDINKVERINYENGFYYLQLTPEDSVISTNGEVLTTRDKKTIVWDRSFSTLKFELFSTSFSDGQSRNLLPFLD